MNKEITREDIRNGVRLIKQMGHRQPPYELPADSHIEDTVKAILTQWLEAPERKVEDPYQVSKSS